jgi:hypothetical protein
MAETSTSTRTRTSTIEERFRSSIVLVLELVLPMNTVWISLIVRSLDVFGFDGYGPKKVAFLGGSAGGCRLFWKKHHAQFRRLGSQVLDFGFLVFDFVVLHAFVDILGSVLEHSVDERG